MGYRGKVAEREQARVLRASGLTLVDIATKLGVSKGSVSVWVRDVPFTPSTRRYGPRVRPNKLMQRKQAEIESMLEDGRRRIGALTERQFLVAGAALYAGEGAKRDRMVLFANRDARLIRFFTAWLRHFFVIDESRLRVRIYLHEGLDLEGAVAFWSDVTGVPSSQFHKAYRARPNPTIRNTKHAHGCAYGSTPAAGHTVKSWVSCTPCYPAMPFPG
jgi:hypothetical protein